MAVLKKIDVPFDIPLPIVLDDSFSVFKYSSFNRGYHVYKDRWLPTMILCIVKKKKATSTTNMQLR